MYPLQSLNQLKNLLLAAGWLQALVFATSCPGWLSAQLQLPALALPVVIPGKKRQVQPF